LKLLGKMPRIQDRGTVAFESVWNLALHLLCFCSAAVSTLCLWCNYINGSILSPSGCWFVLNAPYILKCSLNPSPAELRVQKTCFRLRCSSSRFWPSPMAVSSLPTWPIHFFIFILFYLYRPMASLYELSEL
jgi:hypothetical protein